MLRHFIALRFAPGTSSEVKSRLMQDLATLGSEIDGIINSQARKKVGVETPLIDNFPEGRFKPAGT